MQSSELLFHQALMCAVCVSCRMAEWVKKQAEREAEKEQRRLERLQRKLAEPRHTFTDPEYERQYREMAERQEESLRIGTAPETPPASCSSRI